jgi:hypothetical protein
VKSIHSTVYLKTYLDMAYLHQVNSFVETSAMVFGLEKEDALKLVLAGEEIFSYICMVSSPSTPITIDLMNGIYYVRARFHFDPASMNLQALNLTSKASVTEEAGLEEMGLLIASRSVDSCYISHRSKEGKALVLVKERRYPEVSAQAVVPEMDFASFAIRPADSETLKTLSRQVVNHYPSSLYPGSFRFPGKMVDMVGSGEYGAVVAVDNENRVAGGIVWYVAETQMVELFGPYIFSGGDRRIMAEGLVDAAISAVAKTDALYLLNRYSTPELPEGYFQLLNVIDYVDSSGVVFPISIYCRELKEDHGTYVFADEKLDGFLRAQYSRLALPRKIELTESQGESRGQASVFAASFTHGHNSVSLRPIVDGRDTAENVANHLKALQEEGVNNIFFELDLAHPWQVRITPVLLDQGFQPVLLIPYGGDKDIVIFQYKRS